jgi:excisionase family DNA binding protein
MTVPGAPVEISPVRRSAMSAAATLETPVAEGAAQWITLGLAARQLAVSVTTVRRLTRDGTLSYRRIPGAWPRVRADEVDALAARSTRPAVVGSNPS